MAGFKTASEKKDSGLDRGACINPLRLLVVLYRCPG